MTATTLPTRTLDTTPTTTVAGAKLWRTGAIVGLVAGAATAVVAAVADAAGVAFEIGGKAIPLWGFAQLTFVFTMVGAAIAVVLSHRARRPQHTFVVTTVVLTALSVVPDITADAPVSTRLVLALTHVVAASIVIPVLARRLRTERV